MTPFRIDALQYCNWSEEVFRQMRTGGVDAVHATIAYHEGFRETVDRIVAWNRLFRQHSDLIAPARSTADIRAVRDSGRTAILFGAQNPQVIENDIGLVEVLHRLGLCFMQLTYNNQSLLGTGWKEREDPGLTRMGRAVLAEMNRLGMVADLSHAAERTTLEAIAASTRPVAVTHANPRNWCETGRNVTGRVMDALAESGGMLGLSLYPNHLAGGPDCTLEEFCEMAARTAERMGVARVGIGSDLCQGQPDTVVEWMRTGRWTHARSGATFPGQQTWFRDNRDWEGIATGLRAAGFDAVETGQIMGGNWLRFLDSALKPR
ncbi:membrane dipeptidase [Rhodobacteraceae bacterium NNCM2]|nr:membrane dipeptidase [Coraliihabitans acroporae]